MPAVADIMMMLTPNKTMMMDYDQNLNHFKPIKLTIK